MLQVLYEALLGFLLLQKGGENRMVYGLAAAPQKKPTPLCQLPFPVTGGGIPGRKGRWLLSI